MIALCLGHSRQIHGRTEGGAYSIDGITEHTYWSEVAPMISDLLQAAGQDCKVIDHYQGGSYFGSMQWLAGQMRQINATCAVELHFNAAHPTANGHEWLHWHSSKRGAELAASLSSAFTDKFIGQIRRRAILPIDSTGRGAGYLRTLPPPCVICEPFFGSNESDWKIATENKEGIASAIAEGILDWV